MVDRILALFVLALVLGLPLGLIFLVTGQFLMDFVFFYPLFMSALWIAGGLYFWLHWERHWPWEEDTPAPLPPELQPCATALGRAIATLAQRGQHPFFMPHRLDDAGWLANRWSEILPIPLATRHKLMMLPDPLARLRLVDGFLRRHGIVGG